MAGKNQGNGPGMGGPGQGEGGVAPETPGDTGLEKTKIPGQLGPGRIVGAWTTKGEPPKGEARVEYEQVVESAAEEAMDALSKQRVPATQREYVRDYFEAIRGKNPANPDK
jgi:hypothetical protein